MDAIRHKIKGALFGIALSCLCSAAIVRADTLQLVVGSKEEGADAAESPLLRPFGVGFDKEGTMYVVEYEGHRVRAIDKKGVIKTVAGNGEKGLGHENGSAEQSQFNAPHNLVVAPDGDLYVADTMNNRVRRVCTYTNRVSTLAGTGKAGFSGDGGKAEKAQFGGIYCVALDHKAENLYVDDLDNRRIRKIHLSSGIVTTVAGNGERGVPADGSDAAKSPLVDPRAIAVDSKGNLYILERSGNALRVVDTKGKIRTVVGTGKAGPAVDGGDAKQATLRGPKHLCIDRENNVLIADTDNHVIRKYLPKEGKIVRVAGTGMPGRAGIGGPPEQAELNEPHGVTVDSSGVLYIADSWNNRIVKIAK